VKPEAQHLTFAFLGEQNEELVPAICSELEKAFAAIPRFQASLRGCGYFPNSRNARVGWVGLDPEQRFADAAATAREAVHRSGVQLDSAEFKPHLTLMRLRDRWPPASIELFLRTFRDYRSATFDVATVTLFSSRLLPTGAIHAPLCEIPLA
jgi:2'-5' RNA ligase